MHKIIKLFAYLYKNIYTLENCGTILTVYLKIHKEPNKLLI